MPLGPSSTFLFPAGHVSCEELHTLQSLWLSGTPLGNGPMLGAFELAGWALCEGAFTGGVWDLRRFRDSSGGLLREQQRLQRDPAFQHGHPYQRHRAHRRLPGHLWQSVDEFHLQSRLGRVSATMRSDEALWGCCDMK